MAFFIPPPSKRSSGSVSDNGGDEGLGHNVSGEQLPVVSQRVAILLSGDHETQMHRIASLRLSMAGIGFYSKS